MKGNFLLISGTASRSCPPEQLARGIQFIELLTAEVLRAGGGLVVLLGDENRTKGPDGNPRIFDWIIMRAIERYATNTIEPARTLAWVVMSDDAWDRKMDDNNRRIFTSLQQRGVLEIERIRREEFTGGAYRRSECELADVMVALGGGKGTYSLGMDMIDLGKPVLPVDLEIGSLSEDGEGAVQLHREMLSDPGAYFPRTHGDVVNQMETLSLERSGHDVASVALRAVELLSRELAAGATDKGSDVKPLVGNIGTGVNRFLSSVGIIRAVEFLRNLLTGG